MVKKITQATAEEVAEQSKTVKPTKEEKEKLGMTDDLATKRAQLKNDEVNLYGGNVNIGQGVQHLAPLPDRIKVMNRNIEKTDLMIAGLKPVNPKFEFENDERYIEIQKEELAEEKAGKVKHAAESVKLRDELKQRIPITKTEINELEKKLKLPITDFKKEKPDYIG